MYSPKDRIYNTPDVSYSAANAILQQLRLERVLRKIGFFTTQKLHWQCPNTGPVHLPILTPARTIQPFGTREWMNRNGAVGHDPDILRPLNDKNLKPRKPNQTTVPSDRATIQGAPYNDPFLKKRKNTVGCCKYGGVHLSEFAPKSDYQKPEIFKPFYPQRSPMRLPSIQREKTDIDIGKPGVSTLEDKEIAKHVRLQKQNLYRTDKIQSKETIKRKKRAKNEQMFQEWQQTQDIYNKKKLPGLAHTSDHFLLQNQERFHIVDNRIEDTEQVYRDKISSEIKRGVQQKLELFRDRDGGANGSVDPIPVCHVTFASGSKGGKKNIKNKSKKKRKQKKHK